MSKRIIKTDSEIQAKKDQIKTGIKTKFDNNQVSIADGNSKLGKTPNFNLSPVKSCPNCTDCKKDCYALKYYNQYVNTEIAYDSNLLIAKYKPNVLKQSIIDFLSKKRRNSITKFRIHGSGDMFSQSYFELWIDIAKLYPRITFFMFTKNYNLDFSNIPDNMIIRYSVFYNSDNIPESIKSLPKAYTITDVKITEKNNGYICPCDCRNCNFCSDINSKMLDVYFPLH